MCLALQSTNLARLTAKLVNYTMWRDLAERVVVQSWEEEVRKKRRRVIADDTDDDDEEGEKKEEGKGEEAAETTDEGLLNYDEKQRTAIVKSIQDGQLTHNQDCCKEPTQFHCVCGGSEYCCNNGQKCHPFAESLNMVSAIKRKAWKDGRLEDDEKVHPSVARVVKKNWGRRDEMRAKKEKKVSNSGQDDDAATAAAACQDAAIDLSATAAADSQKAEEEEEEEQSQKKAFLRECNK